MTVLSASCSSDFHSVGRRNWLAAARISHRIGYIHFGVCCALLFVVNSLYFVIFSFSSFLLFFNLKCSISSFHVHLRMKTYGGSGQSEGFSLSRRFFIWMRTFSRTDIRRQFNLWHIYKGLKAHLPLFMLWITLHKQKESSWKLFFREKNKYTTWNVNDDDSNDEIE